MGSSSLEEENIIEDVRNLFRLEKLKKKQLMPQLEMEVENPINNSK